MKNNINEKKAQIEVFGLAIIVVLVLIGLVLVVKLGYLAPQSKDVKASFASTQLTSNLLSTLLRTSTGCKNTDVTDLLIDCTNYHPTGSIDCNDDLTPDSCQNANAIIEKVVQSVTDVDYVLYVKLNGENVPGLQDSYPNNGRSGQCPEQQKSGEFPFTTKNGKLAVGINVCVY